ncbi:MULTISPECIES: hypothetical protein [unclassified Kitasatospora]|uniref:hypothetical protein n=1 Tax=unclassified Kitasatospora TaxID=2633591 RepID=UPI00070BBA3E|nr:MULTISPECIES: hypothetical protein [unclassified Kitasatospora]KQV11805.1 hypothetical protein ASC99_10280 [Kitasatospora sp. Root107]KRB76614.1 hypothetical protein ASE03_13115 [Kitasatospora sp. Root187]
MTEDQNSNDKEDIPAYGEPERTAQHSARRRLAIVLAALFLAMLGYKVLHAGGLEQTALFYVGLPAVIAITVALSARPKSATGTAMASVTIGLALAGPLLNEGIICLLIAAPLFYLVAACIGRAVDRSRRPAKEPGGRQRLNAFALAPLLGLAVLQGVDGTVERDSTVTVTRTLSVTPDQFAAALAAPPVFGTPRPVFLKVPFPRPQQVTGSGLAVGDGRLITFNPRKSLGIGATPTPRSMTLRIAEHDQGRVLFRVEQDSTTARWLNFRTSEVRWQPTADGGTQVTWQLGYQRTFDPGWYFGPIQNYGMEQAANYLADTFTPGS